MFLHDIFYPECKPITDFSVFDEFMFTIPTTSENVEFEKDKTTKNPIIKIEDKLEELILKTEDKIEETKQPILNRLEKECIFAKNVQDGLFWSMYILHYGYTEYHRNKYNYGKLEVQEKEKIAEYLHTNGSQKISKQTNYKLTRGFCCEIESDLITTPKMSFSGLIGMAAYYQCNIFVVDLTKNIYYVFSGGIEETDDKISNTKETYILYKNPLYNGKFKSNEYFIDIDHKILSLSEIKERFFEINNYQKPMKSITNYKKIELECISQKLLLNSDTSISVKDKNSLYEIILLHISSSVESHR